MTLLVVQTVSIAFSNPYSNMKIFFKVEPTQLAFIIFGASMAALALFNLSNELILVWHLVFLTTAHIS